MKDFLVIEVILQTPELSQSAVEEEEEEILLLWLLLLLLIVVVVNETVVEGEDTQAGQVVPIDRAIDR